MRHGPTGEHPTTLHVHPCLTVVMKYTPVVMNNTIMVMKL